MTKTNSINIGASSLSILNDKTRHFKPKKLEYVQYLVLKCDIFTSSVTISTAWVKIGSVFMLVWKKGFL